MKAALRRSLHRAVWQRLPRELRRSLFFAATRAAAPRPDRGTRLAEPIIVVGALRNSTGLGEGARLCYQALERAGFDVRAIDCSARVFQPLDVPDFHFRDGRDGAGEGTLLLHVNAPLLPFVLSWLGRRIVAEKHVVGYWAWELPEIPPAWVKVAPFVHEIWTPSRFTAVAVSACIEDRPVRVLPHPVAIRAEGWVPRPDRATRPFTALNVFDMGSSFARKNPLAAVAAFRRAFGEREEGRLVVKVNNPGLFPAGAQALRAAVEGARNIALIEETLVPARLAELYAATDALISTHRAEGFGLVPAEAMLRGLPVVATNWSATAEFVTAETGCPIPYRLVPARDPQGEYDHPRLHWADPDPEAGAAQLLRLRHPAARRVLGEAARQDAMSRFGAQRYAETVRSFLPEGQGA